MSIIAAGTTTTTALSSTGNTDGTLQLQVNGTTPSVTLNTLGAIGVGSTPAFGTSGQVLTSAGSTAAPAWATPSAVNLTTGVTGTLPISNGGTGTTSTTFANLTTNVTGTLPIANGGTGQTALSAVSVGTATNLAGGSNGTIPYQSASGTTQMLAVGSAGQVLQTNGAGAPTWATPAAGAMVLLASQTVSSATTYVTFSNVFSSTYDNYLIVFNNVAFSSSYAYTGGILQAQFQRSGSFVTTGYYGQYGSLMGSTAATTALDEGMTVGALSKANNNFVSGTLYCLGMNTTSSTGGIIQKFLGYTSYNTVSGSWGQLGVDAVTTGIRFFVESTNTTIAIGSFYVYGIAKS